MPHPMEEPFLILAADGPIFISATFHPLNQHPSRIPIFYWNR